MVKRKAKRALRHMDDQGLETVFKGLADINRLRILNVLFCGELCGCDIQYALRVPQSNVSRHLTYLKNCGLVLDRRSGNKMYYRLAQTTSGDCKLLFEYLQHAFGHDRGFKEDAKRLREVTENGACSLSEAPSKTPAARRVAGRRMSV